MRLTVEFLGLARRLTQTRESLVDLDDQATFRDVLRHLAARFPSLCESVIRRDSFDLVPSYMLNLNGRRAVRDLDMPAEDGQRLLLMFLEAGG
ncbi:MAG: MoaD/ThiS family protein [Anaerolineae bacterium]|nr:MoaD/ThiS family protein [Anaerolineae bacterium]